MGEYKWAKGGKAVPQFHLVIYPGEKSSVGTCEDRQGNTSTCDLWRGTIRVKSGKDEVAAFMMMGGPKTARPDGSYTAEPTPSGEFRLGAAENHATKHWPASCVPWGAQINRGNPTDPTTDVDEYYYFLSPSLEPSPKDPGWKALTGRTGALTVAILEQRKRENAKLDPAHQYPVPEYGTSDWISFNQDVKRWLVYTPKEAGWLHDPTLEGRPLTTWIRNDFGMWAFNLRMKQGDKWARSRFYIHTTPINELETIAGSGDTTGLEQSHGCIHIRPRDRIKAMALGYFSRGMKVEIKPYGEIGPPPRTT